MKKLLVTMVAALSAVFAARAVADVHTTTFDTAPDGDFAAGSYQEDSKYYWYSEADVSGSIAAGGATNTAKYLEVATYAPLYRAVNGSSSQFSGAPSSAAVLTEGTVYADMFIKFSVRDEPPELDAGNTKLGVWMQEAGGTTNLYFKAASLNGSTVTTNNYIITTKGGSALTAASLVDNQWHRLTVKAIGNVATEGTVPAFAAFLDGDILGYDTSVTGISNVTLNDIGTHLYNSDRHCLFPSMAQSDATLASVSITGQGAVDEVGFMTTAPVDEARDVAAKIDNTYYFTFADAVSAYTAGKEIVVVNAAAGGAIPTGWELTSSDTRLTKIQCTATFVTAHGVVPVAQTVDYGTAVSNPGTLSADGYKFVGWYENDTAYDFSTELTGNKTITAKWLQYVTVPTLGNKVYNGSTQVADVPANAGYTVVANAGGVNVGTYSVTLALSDANAYIWVGDATANQTANWDITRATATVTAENKTKTYGEADPALTATVTGLCGSDTVAYTLSRAAGTAAGATYAITPTGTAVQDNYNVVFVPGTLTINRKAVTVTANDATKVAGNADPSFNATVSGLVDGESESLISYTISRDAGEAVGTYDITPVGDATQGNYSVAYVNGKLTITAAGAMVIEFAGATSTTNYFGTLAAAVATADSTNKVVEICADNAETGVDTTGKAFTFSEGEYTFTGTFDGSGTIRMTGKPKSYTAANNTSLFAGTWTGTCQIAWNPGNARFVVDEFGNANSTVEIIGVNGTFGAFPFSAWSGGDAPTINTMVSIAEGTTWTISDGNAHKNDSDWNITEFALLTGSGNLVVNGSGTGNRSEPLEYTFSVISNFTGTLSGTRGRYKFGDICYDGTDFDDCLVKFAGGAYVPYYRDLDDTTVNEGEDFLLVGTVSDQPGIYRARAIVDGTPYLAVAEAIAAADADVSILTVTVRDGSSATFPGWTLSGNTYNAAIAYVERLDSYYGSLAAAISASGTTVPTEVTLIKNTTETTLNIPANVTVVVGAAAFPGTLSGAGAICYTQSPADFSPARFVSGDNGWTGTFIMNWPDTANSKDTPWVLDNYGISGSTVQLNQNIKGYLKNKDAGAHPSISPNVKLNGTTLHVANGYSREADDEWTTNIASMPALGGSAGSELKLVWDNKPSSQAGNKYAYYSVAVLDNYLGSLNVGPNMRLKLGSANYPDAATAEDKVVANTCTIPVTLNADGKIVNSSGSNITSAGIPVTIAGEDIGSKLVYAVISGESGLYKAVAQVGDNYYATYQAAVDGNPAANEIAVLDETAGDVPSGWVFNGDSSKLLKQFSVTFTTAHGVVPDAQTVAYGGTATEPTAPTEAGYTFDGWLLNDAPFAFTTPIEGNIALTAKWLTNVAKPTAATDLVYDGTVQTGVAAGTGYTLANNTATAAGDYTATATLDTGYIWSDNTTETVSLPWSIGQKELTITANSASRAYNGAALTDDGYTAGEVATGDTIDSVTVTGSQTIVGSSANVPSAAVIKRGDADVTGNYDITYVNGALTITAAKVAVPEAVTGLVYDNTEKTGVAASVGYTLEGNTATAAGSHTATATLAANYVWSDDTTAPKEITWSIAAKPVAVSVSASTDTKTYNGEEQTFTPAFTYTCGDGLFDSSKVTFSGTAMLSRTEVGTTQQGLAAAQFGYTDTNLAVTFTVTQDGSLTISKKGLTITVAGTTSTSLEYTGSEQTVTVDSSKYTLTCADSLYDASKVTRTATTASGTNVKADYALGLAASQFGYSDTNVEAEFVVTDGTFAITPKAATITVTAASKTYGDADPAFTGTVEGLVNASDLGTITYSRTGSDENAATYPAVLTASYTANANYTVTVTPGDFTINKAPLSVTAKAKTITYGDAPANDGVTYSGFVNSETESVLGGTLTYAYTYSQYGDVGSYTITPSGQTSDNYAITFAAGTLTVGPKTVGLDWSADSLTYTGSAQAPTATATGLVNGDAVSVTVDGAQTNVGGPYTATATALAGAKAGNYALPSPATHEFTITAADGLVITVAGYNAAYDGAAHGPTATVTLNGEPETGATVTWSVDGGEFTSEVPSITDVGTKTVVAKATKTGYADATSAAATLKVTAKEVAVVWSDTALTYNGSAQAPSAALAEGAVVVGDDVSVTVSVDGDHTNAAEDYVATASLTGEDAGNYALASATATAKFDIAKKAASVTVDAGQTKVYGSADPTLTATVDGVIGSDTLAYTLSRAEGEAVGTYAITVTLGSNPNYNVTTTDGTFTITAKGLTITVAAKSKTYGEADPALTYDVVGLEVGDALTGALARDAGENVGEYNITQGTLAAGDNYLVTFNGAKLTITPKAATIMVTAASKTYGAADPAFTGTVEGLVNASDLGTITYSRTGSDENAATYPAVLTASYTANANYTVTVTPGDFTISKAPLSVTAKAKTITYGDAPANDGVTYSGFVNSETESVLGGTLAYAYTYSQYGDVGSYTITPSGLTSGNYEITFNAGTLTVVAKEVGLTWGETELTYSGSEQAPMVTATGLVNNDVVGVTVTGAQTAVGEGYTATASELTGVKAGNYALPAANTTTFKIVSASGLVITVAGYNAAYDGAAHGPTATVTLNGEPETGATVTWSVDGGEFTSEVPSITDVGTKTVVAKATKTGYADATSAAATLMVTAKEVALVWSDTAFTYNGSAQAPSAALAEGAVVGDDDVSVTVSVEGDHTSAADDIVATASLTGEDAGNYALASATATTTFDIAKKAASVTVDAGKTKTYGAADPTLTATVDGVIGSDTLAYTLSRAEGEAVGTYAITVTLGSNPNYDVTKTDGTFTITAKGLTITVAAKSKTYGAADPELTYTVDGLETGDALTGALARDAGENVGEYNITQGTLSAGDNYSVTFNGAKLTITAAKVAVPTAVAGLVYDGTVKTGVATGANYTLADNTGTAAGSYTATATLTDAANYTWTDGTTAAKEIAWSIGKATVAVTADAKTQVYGAEPVALTYTAGELVAGNEFSGALARAEGENVGHYAINVGTLTAGSNYEISFTGADYEITAAKVAVPAAVTGLVYDGTEKTGVATGTGYTLSGNTATAAGSHTATATLTDAANYTWTDGTTAAKEIAWSIAAKTVTLTWSNTSFTYDGNAHVPTATAGGVAAGDSLVVTVEVQDGPAVSVGGYTAVATGLTGTGAANYELPAEATANFTISEAGGLAITIANYNAAYDGQSHSAVATVTIDDEPASGVTVTYKVDDGEFTSAVPSITDVGTKSIVAKAEKTGYTTVTATATLTVTKAPLTVTAKDKEITYGDAPANDGVSYSGFVGSDTAASLSGTLAYAYSYSQYGDVGSYTITPSGLTSDNYAITFAAGTLTVGQKTVGLDWSADSLTYTGSAQAPTATATGLVNGDAVSVTVDGAQTAAGEDYTATASLTGDKAANYALPADPTTAFDIAQREVTITWSNTEFSYDGTSHVPTATLGNVVDGDVVGVTVTGAATSAGTHTAEASALTGDDAGNYKLPAANTTTFEIKDSGIVIQFL